jgi:hypothetical protein
MSENPWAPPQVTGAGYPTAAPYVPWESSPRAEAKPKRVRPLAILIGVGLVLVIASIAAPIAGRVAGTLARHNSSGPPASELVSIPDTPPSTLLGQSANPAGIQENSEWRELTTKAKAASTSAFGSVYGEYPPAGRTTDTFLVVGAEPDGGIGDVPTELRREVNGAEGAIAKVPGAQVETLPVQTSVLGGSVACVSVTTANGAFGECLWMDSAIVVTVGTFTDDLLAVNSMTQQVVNELHSPASKE